MQSLSLSFCGCGFLGIYHLGVVSALVKHGRPFLARVERVAGASAGALAAALLVTSPTPASIKAANEMSINMAETVRSKRLGPLSPGYRMTSDLEKIVSRMLPPDAHEMASGKLFISLTNLQQRRNEIVSCFHSRQDLISVLMASCHIPVYSGSPFLTLRGQLYCDGGLTNNMVRFSDLTTVTVSPFSGQQDICPRDPVKGGQKPRYFNLRSHIIQMNAENVLRFQHAFVPPQSSVLQQYFQQGKSEATRFLVKKGFYETSASTESHNSGECCVS